MEPNEYNVTNDLVKELGEELGFRPNDFWTKIYAIVLVVLALKKRGII